MAGLIRHPILTARVHAGLNAGAILAGLAGLIGDRLLRLDELAAERFPELAPRLRLSRSWRGAVAGWECAIDCPPRPGAGHHTALATVLSELRRSRLSKPARRLAENAWWRLARAEAEVHGLAPDAAEFHEVGRPANVVASGLIAELFLALGPEELWLSPLPLGDGAVRCAHGLISNPAPALLAQLDGVAVTAAASSEETVTPTGLAIMLALGARCGGWPDMLVRRHATSFMNGRTFAGVPNGLLWALGERLPA